MPPRTDEHERAGAGDARAGDARAGDAVTDDNAGEPDPDEFWPGSGIGGLFRTAAGPAGPPPEAAPGGQHGNGAAGHRRRRVAGYGAPAGPGRRTHARSGTPRTEMVPAIAGPAPAATAASPAAVATVESPDGLASSLLLPPRRRAPAPGWRRVIYRASAGFIRIPTSAAEERRRDMIARTRAPVASGHYRVAVLSLKGGVGKTTTAVGLGSTLAAMRGDRVIALDANPDRGTLADKLTPQTDATIRDLLEARRQIHRYADVRGFTSQAPSRLEILASAQDPAASVAFSEQDYSDACAVLERFYSICITDCGTGLLHSAMAGVLRLADQIVLVTTGSVDGARSAIACMDWLAAHGHQDLVGDGVVVVTAARPRSRTTVDLDLLEGHLAARCRAVTRIPYDPYLAQGADVELDQMRKGTATAFLELAALVADGFARRRGEPRAIESQPAERSSS